MSEVFLDILTSRWATSSLQWYDEWVWSHDRPLGVLTDDDVLAKYGDEAFRRRDVLLATGQQTFEPPLSNLIGRRIEDVMRLAGWEAVVDNQRNFEAVRGASRLEVSGERNGTLILREERTTEMTSHLGAAEKWLLLKAVGMDRMSELSEIMSAH